VTIPASSVATSRTSRTKAGSSVSIQAPNLTRSRRNLSRLSASPSPSTNTGSFRELRGFGALNVRGIRRPEIWRRSGSAGRTSMADAEPMWLTVYWGQTHLYKHKVRGQSHTVPENAASRQNRQGTGLSGGLIAGRVSEIRGLRNSGRRIDLHHSDTPPLQCAPFVTLIWPLLFLPPFFCRRRRISEFGHAVHISAAENLTLGAAKSIWLDRIYDSVQP
jgi:hypothetical protein